MCIIMVRRDAFSVVPPQDAGSTASYKSVVDDTRTGVICRPPASRDLSANPTPVKNSLLA